MEKHNRNLKINSEKVIATSCNRNGNVEKLRNLTQKKNALQNCLRKIEPFKNIITSEARIFF